MQLTQLRIQKYERLLRRIRQRIFDYEDISEQKYEHARHIMLRCKAILSPYWQEEFEKRELQREGAFIRMWA